MLFLIYLFFEIWLLLVFGSALGPGTALLWIILSSILGLWLLRHLGYRAILNLRSGLNNQTKDNDIVDNSLYALGCLGLMIPAFFSDFIGIALMLPFVRKMIITKLYRGVAQAYYQKQTPKGRIYTAKIDDNSNKN